jgi:hypothetical protein
LSQLRKHNAPKVGWWLESYGDRFGAGPQEILRIENRKLLGSVPINAALEEILGDEDLKKSDGVMLYLIFVRMRQERRDLFDALFDTYLQPGFSIGDLDRIGVQAVRGDKEAFNLVMRVFKARVWLLDELDNWVEPGRPPGEEKGHRLEVERGERARSKREARAQDQTDLAEANYAGMVEDYDALKEREPHLGEREAQQRVADWWHVTDRTVRNALKAVRSGAGAGGEA